MVSAKQLNDSDEHWLGGDRLDRSARDVDSLIHVEESN